MITKSQILIRIRSLREELESRHKTGMAKIADNSGTIVATEILQNELYSLILKLSRME
jgi:hypothetical protein